MTFHFVHFGTDDRLLATKVFELGWMGVDLFFVLSGFLITGILLRAKGKPSYFKSFYMRRVLRIFPLYYGTLAVIFLVIPHFVVIDSPDMLRLYRDQGWLWAYGINILTAIRGTLDFNQGWIWLNHFWSLCIEEHFYLFWRAIVFFLSRKGLIRVSAAILVLVPILRTVLVLSHVSTVTIYSFTLCRLDALAGGGLLAVVAAQPDGLRRLVRVAPMALSFAVVMLAGILSLRQSPSFVGPVMQCIGYSMVGLGSAALLVLSLSPQRGALSWVLESRPLMIVGKYSYGAYVLHQILQPAFIHWFPADRIAAATGSRTLGVLGHVAGSLALSLLAAVVSWHLYEKHFLNLKRYFEYGRVSPRVTTLPKAVPGPP
jgi:peptidoglycan/LPS O-acetylase OafA/YrhL